MKDTQIDKLRFLTLIKDVNFPIELINEVISWDILCKSPKSFSFYNAKVDWGYKPDKSLRISDHWNFESWNTVHCKTLNNVPNTTHWAIGRYVESKKAYEILDIFEKPKAATKTSFIYQYNMLFFRLDKAIQHTPVPKVVELAFMSKYYELLETNLIDPEKINQYDRFY